MPVPPPKPWKHYPQWTKAEDAIIRRHMARQAARLTGRTLKAIRGRRIKLGLPAESRPRWTPAEDKIVLAKTPREAAKRLPHRAIQSIRYRRGLLARGLVRPKKPRKKPRKHYIRLNPEIEMLIIRDAKIKGVLALAKELGISRQTVYVILKRHNRMARPEGEKRFRVKPR